MSLNRILLSLLILTAKRISNSDIDDLVFYKMVENGFKTKEQLYLTQDFSDLKELYRNSIISENYNNSLTKFVESNFANFDKIKFSKNKKDIDENIEFFNNFNKTYTYDDYYTTTSDDNYIFDYDINKDKLLNFYQSFIARPKLFAFILYISLFNSISKYDKDYDYIKFIDIKSSDDFNEKFKYLFNKNLKYEYSKNKISSIVTLNRVCDDLEKFRGPVVKSDVDCLKKIINVKACSQLL
jgi:hypothetical protein